MRVVSDPKIIEPVVALLHEPGSDPLLLSENGRAAAVLMSAEEYGRLRARSLEEFQQLCEKASAEAQANGLTEEILQEILAEAKAGPRSVRNLQDFEGGGFLDR